MQSLTHKSLSVFEKSRKQIVTDGQSFVTAPLSKKGKTVKFIKKFFSWLYYAKENMNDERENELFHDFVY